MAEAPKARSGASQASASPAPNPGSSIQPALPAQPGRGLGQVCTHSEHNANTPHRGPCYPKNMSHTCWVLRAPVSMRGDAGRQAGWLTQRVTEHTPMGAAQGDTGQAGPYLHPPDILNRVLVQLSLTKEVTPLRRVWSSLIWSYPRGKSKDVEK